MVASPGSTNFKLAEDGAVEGAIARGLEGRLGGQMGKQKGTEGKMGLLKIGLRAHGEASVRDSSWE